jgi:hypothetical protein
LGRGDGSCHMFAMIESADSLACAGQCAIQHMRRFGAGSLCRFLGRSALSPSPHTPARNISRHTHTPRLCDGRRVVVGAWCLALPRLIGARIGAQRSLCAGSCAQWRVYTAGVGCCVSCVRRATADTRSRTRARGDGRSFFTFCVQGGRSAMELAPGWAPRPVRWGQL